MSLFARLMLPNPSVAGATITHASLVTGQGTWETTLNARDINGNAVTLSNASAAFFRDCRKNLTSLAKLNANGARTWASASSIRGVTDWRLRAIIDSGATVDDGGTGPEPSLAWALTELAGLGVARRRRRQQSMTRNWDFARSACGPALLVLLTGMVLATPARAEPMSSPVFVDARFTAFSGPSRLSFPSGPILTGTVNGVTPDFSSGISFDTGRGNTTTYRLGQIAPPGGGAIFPPNPTRSLSLLDGEATAGSPGENIFSWAAPTIPTATEDVPFTLARLTFQNGDWFGAGANGVENIPTIMDFVVTTTSPLFPRWSQTRSLQLRYTVYSPFPNDTTTRAGQEAAADWVTIFDPDRGVALNSFRVFEFGATPAGFSNVGSVDLIGRFNSQGPVFQSGAARAGFSNVGSFDFEDDISLDIIGFANPGGGFLTESDLPLDPGGGVPAVPEPATWAMLIAGLGFVGAALRRRRGFSAA